MGRLIDAEKHKESVERWQRILAKTYGKNDEYVVCIEGVLELLEDAPTVDAEPVRHGRWEYDDELNVGIYALCSVCGESIYQCGTWYYCPNCGAKMDGGDGDAVSVED